MSCLVDNDLFCYGLIVISSKNVNVHCLTVNYRRNTICTLMRAAVERLRPQEELGSTFQAQPG